MASLRFCIHVLTLLLCVFLAWHTAGMFAGSERQCRLQEVFGNTLEWFTGTPVLLLGGFWLQGSGWSCRRWGQEEVRLKIRDPSTQARQAPPDTREDLAAHRHLTLPRSMVGTLVAPCCESDCSLWPQGDLLTLPEQVLHPLPHQCPHRHLYMKPQWKLSEEGRELKGSAGRAAVLGAAK